MGGGRGGPVAIVAGSGRLPDLLSARLQAHGVEHRILALRGFAGSSVRRRAQASVDLLDVKRTLGTLDTWAPSAVALVGGVQRPNPAAVLGALAAFRNRHELADLLARGDDHLLRGVIGLFEERGHAVAGLQDLAPELLARAGVLGRVSPRDGASRSIAIGFDVLDRLSPFDIGQAVVVAGRRVLGVEGPEGTDRMLARVRPSRLAGLFAGPARTGPILVKTAKKGQDLRVDLPAIGPRTLERAARAGLEGVAIGASCTLVIDEPETVAAADRLGLFLVALDRASLAQESQ